MKNFVSKKTMKTAMTIFSIMAFVVVVGFLLKYNNDKNMLVNNMNNMNHLSPSEINVNSEVSSVNKPLEENMNLNNSKSSEAVVGRIDPEINNYLSVQGLGKSKTDKSSCNNQPVMDPKELLPLDNNKQWNNIAPNKDLKNLNLVNAGQHIGINTISGSLRNPNLQIRSEPIIPKNNIGPWNNTTIEPDKTRKGFEIDFS